MLTRFGVLVLCCSVQNTLLCAPLLHAHLDDHRTSHHDGVTVHAHVDTHHAVHDTHGIVPGPTAGPMEERDEDVRSISGFSVVLTAAAPAAETTDFARLQPVPLVGCLGPRTTTPRAHGPPCPLASGLRAPPA